MGEKLNKANLLVESGRFHDALELLTSVLSEDPENREALYLKSFALGQIDEWKLALETGKQLIATAPDWSWSHHQVGLVLNQIDKDKQAIQYAKDALRLDPGEPDHFALLASCYAGVDDWKRMLAASEKGLELDPEHRHCILMRSNALRLMKRSDEAGSAIEHLGGLSPNDPDVHTSLGWLRLQEGKATEAVNHFREALRLDPDDAPAREGLVHALKGQNILYRPILAWYMLSARLGQRGSMALILGMWFGMQFLDKIPGPNWVPIALGAVYFLFVWLSWVGSSLFDLMLYLRRDLREILSKGERRGAVALGVSILCGCIFAGVALPRGAGITPLVILAAFFFAGIPISGSVSMRNAKARTISGLIAVVAFLFGLAGTVPLLIDPFENPNSSIPLHDQAGQLLWISIMISLFSTWAILALGFVPERRGRR